MVKVLFVCLGNICRSPTAEGVFRKLLQERGLTNEITVDSAGTSAWHTGEAPDPRAQQEARARGIDLSRMRARGVQPADFKQFDYIVAMDRSNLMDLRQECPTRLQDRVYRCTSFAPQLGVEDVPDPYFGGESGFARVYDIIEQSARGLLEHIIRERGLTPKPLAEP